MIYVDCEPNGASKTFLSFANYEREFFPYRDYPLRHITYPIFKTLTDVGGDATEYTYDYSAITQRLKEMVSEAKVLCSVNGEELASRLGISRKSLGKYIASPYDFPCDPLAHLCAMTSHDYDWVRWGVTHPDGANGEGTISPEDIATMYSSLSESDKACISRIIRPMYWDAWR